MPKHPEQPLNTFFEDQMLRSGWPSVEAMSNASGITGRTLRVVAYGNHEVALVSTITRVARAFGLPIWELIKGLDSANGAEKVS